MKDIERINKNQNCYFDGYNKGYNKARKEILKEVNYLITDIRIKGVLCFQNDPCPTCKEFYLKLKSLEEKEK